MLPTQRPMTPLPPDESAWTCRADFRKENMSYNLSPNPYQTIEDLCLALTLRHSNPSCGPSFLTLVQTHVFGLRPAEMKGLRSLFPLHPRIHIERPRVRVPTILPPRIPRHLRLFCCSNTTTVCSIPRRLRRRHLRLPLAHCSQCPTYRGLCGLSARPLTVVSQRRRHAKHTRSVFLLRTRIRRPTEPPHGH